MSAYTSTYMWTPQPYGLSRVRPGRRFVVQAWEQALVFRRGVLVSTLGPGSYRRWSRGELVRTVDTRPWTVVVPTQEVPTADGASVKVTVAGQARVADPTAFVTGAQEPQSALYLAIQLALRGVVGGKTLEELVTARGSIGAELVAAAVGLEAIGVVVDTLDVKDIVLPADLKRAQAEVLVARAEGQAALERARGETAALRSLANGARLAADNPALLQLRLFQQLAGSSGNTVVIGTPPMLPQPPNG